MPGDRYRAVGLGLVGMASGAILDIALIDFVDAGPTRPRFRRKLGARSTIHGG
jgi:hypothetical protein